VERISDLTLNAAFFILHSAWIVFNCVGWAWRATRRWQLATVTLTVASWVGFGPWYGWGYCPLTDWHWRVRERLGYDDPPSYVQMLFSSLLGIDIAPAAADAIAVVTVAAAAALSVYANFVRGRRSR
jgi:hypothetical protein